MKSKKLCLGILAIMLVFGMLVIGCDEPDNEPKDDRPMGPKWTMVSNLPFGTGSIHDIAYGDGKFIVVGFSSSANSRIAYSTDGINWSLVNNLSPYIYPKAIAYGGGKWVTDDSYSTDGLNWVAATGTLNLDANYPEIVYGGGKFVAVGGNNKIAYSTNGQTWEMVSNPPFGTDSINAIAYGDGKFVAVGGKKIANSTDGINWTAVSPALFDSTISCIAYGGGKFVASDGRNTAYSLDGISWTPIIQNKLEGDWYSINYLHFSTLAFGNNKWIGLDVFGGFMSFMGYSSDGINWTPAFNPPDISLPRAIYGNGKFVVVSSSAVNGHIAYSAQ